MKIGQRLNDVDQRFVLRDITFLLCVFIQIYFSSILISLLLSRQCLVKPYGKFNGIDKLLDLKVECQKKIMRFVFGLFLFHYLPCVKSAGFVNIKRSLAFLHRGKNGCEPNKRILQQNLMVKINYLTWNNYCLNLNIARYY